jgi:hypothetical protein
MRWYRATYNATSGKYTKAAPIKVITERLGAIVSTNKQGAAIAFQGKFTSTEAIRPGAYVIGEDGQVMQGYKVDRRGGMTGIYTYLLTEQGLIIGANG